MPLSSRNSQAKFQLINKSAIIRLGILLTILIAVFIWGWFTLFWMPGQSYTGELKPLNQQEIILQNFLKGDVKKLGDEIGERNANNYQRLSAAVNFLKSGLSQAGYTVKQQEYKINGQSYYNLFVDKIGSKKPNEIIVVGGHYDSVFGSPGANDNGTGAAATLELARIFAQRETNLTIRFVEFTNEEPPFFWTEDMGSFVFAKQLKEQNENVVAMLSLETMGYFSDQEDSQKYPFPIGLFYPNQGSFIAFIGNINSGYLVRKAIASFRRHTQFPSEGAVLPNGVPGVGWSDHWSFWQQGYPAIMVTDTAPYRYTYYHKEEDTSDKIDFNKLTRVVTGLAQVISDLAE
jgi:hypothetical protein